MPRGTPKAGFRKTHRWHERQALERLHGQNPSIKAMPNVKFPHQHHLHLVDNNSPVIQEETDTEIGQRISDRFEILASLTDAAIAGDCRALIVSGPAGVGKSYMVEDKLAKHDPNQLNHTIVKGKALATGVFKMLYKYREQGQILVFDDCDTIFFDDTALNMLKAACDTTEIRRISYLTEGNLYDDEDGEVLPKRFEYEGTIIFITNYDFDEMIGRAHKLAPHLNAIMSRAHYVDMSMKTGRDCMIRIKQVMKNGLLKKKGLNREQEEEIVKFMEANLSKLREVSLRTLLKLADIRKKNNWKTMATVTCCRQK